MAPQESKVSRKAYELPLLKSLVELGGSAIPGDKLYRLVADRIKLPHKGIEYDIVHAQPKWVYDLQWVRYTLVKRGELDGSQRGVWKITEKGRERVRREWNSFNPDNYSSEILEPAIEEDLIEEGEEPAEALVAKFSPESLDTIKGQILIDDTPISQIITITNASRHLILTGPPGTGKTTIAIN